MRKGLVLVIMLILSLALAFYFFPLMPNPMASHWNAAGEVDGFMEKLTFHLFYFGLLAFIAGLFYVIPKIDPLKRNLQQFIAYYWGFAYLVFGFMVYIYLVSALANLGWAINMSLFVIPAVAALFFYIGWIMPKMKRNWFIGVRTPWTLSSDKVWAETHKLGGLVFKILGLAFLAFLVLPDQFILWLVALIVLAAIGLMAYSYFLYRKLEK